MNPEIKQRIEQIKNGEVPEGFNRSGENIVPCNWNCSKINSILKIKHGKSQKGIEIKKGKYPILASGGEIGRTNTPLYDKPSVLIGRKGTIDKPQYMDTPFWTVDTLFYSEIENRMIEKYVFYMFNKINWRKYNEASGVPSLSSSTIESIKIVYPSRPEQQKIAAILSKWDKAIALQENLITHKKEQKRGLMQRLLTGEVRLPGFDGEWKEVRLGDVCEFINGKAHEQNISDDGDYIVVNSKFISTEGSVRKYSNDNLCPLKKNDIVMVMSDIPKGKALAKCYYVEEDNKYTLNQRICSLSTKKDNSIFLYYIINRAKYFLKFDSGVGQTNLRKDQVLNCPLRKPSYDEQQAIANILTQADKETSLLEAKLDILKEQKKGLMQLLLTGIVRVKV